MNESEWNVTETGESLKMQESEKHSASHSCMKRRYEDMHNKSAVGERIVSHPETFYGG